MIESPPIARIASAIGDPARAAMLVALMDGRALTATELSNTAGVTRQTASSHLARLFDEGLIQRHRQGRHHYFALAGESVAQLLEQLMGLGGRPRCSTVATGPSSPALRKARVCYDHLAGDLGVALFDGLHQRGILLVEPATDSPHVRVSETGDAALRALGVEQELPAASGSRRPQCRACLDWSARRLHLAGRLGQVLLEHVLRKGWGERVPDSRIVDFSSRGEAAFLRCFCAREF